MLAIPLVAEGRLPATGALIQSWHALKSQWLTAAVFHWVLIILAVSGVMLLLRRRARHRPALLPLRHPPLPHFFGWGPVSASKKPSDPFPEV